MTIDQAQKAQINVGSIIYLQDLSSKLIFKKNVRRLISDTDIKFRRLSESEQLELWKTKGLFDENAKNAKHNRRKLIFLRKAVRLLFLSGQNRKIRWDKLSGYRL